MARNDREPQRVTSTALRRVQGKKKSGERRDYYDYNLLAAVILLTCFGLVMLYSTSAYEASVNYSGNDAYFFNRQAFISAGCLIALLIFSQFDYHLLTNISTQIYIFSIVLLVATRFIGRNVNGATRWIYITDSLSFQPAELAKLAIILFLPSQIVKMGNEFKGFKKPMIVLGYGALASFCTFKFTDNLSTAIIIAGITVVLIFIAHPKTVPFLAAGAATAALIGLLILLLSADIIEPDRFRLRRIMVWLNPEAYPRDGGYQVMQGLYAIGSGGFFGKGLGNGTQKLGAVPEAQNDMIFSIICEELGVFGALIVIFLFLFLLWRLYVIALNAPDLIGSLVATGIFIHIALQVVLNIAVVINLIPTTGITLPFVSYGGTSIVFLMAEMTIALSISRRSGKG